MMRFPASVATCVALGIATMASTAETVQPVRMGCGIMTFDTVPGWGLRPDGHSALGPTHGAVVIDKEGNIYTSAQKGVVVFSPSGQVIHTYLGKDYSNIHDMEIREEQGRQFVYGARNNDAEGIKFDIRSGEIVLKLGFPEESGLNLQSDGDHRRAQRGYLPLQRLCQQPHFQVRPNGQVSVALRFQGKRTQAI